MGEIDTKPIESVQAALSLFGEKGDQQRKHRSSGSSDAESEKEELEGLQKEVATYKVQLEAKESAYMQILLKLKQYEERVDELSTLLMKSELERDQCIDESKEAHNRVDELETKVREMSDELLEAVKVRDQLVHALSELKSTQAETMENAAAVEREKAEELLKQVEEFRENIVMLKMAAEEAEEEKNVVLSEKDAELENTNKQIQELERLLKEKCDVVSSLQMDITQANEQLSSSKKAAHDSMTELETLKAELECQEGHYSDQDVYIDVLEMEAIRLRQDMSNARESLTQLSCDVELLTSDLEDARAEIKEAKEKETEAEVEMALLKAELHKSRSKIVAAEGAEVRTDSVKSGLYLAVQQLAVESGEASKECERLKHESDEFSFMVEETSSFDEDHKQYEITIQLEEYESLVKREEVEAAKKELEAAMAKVGEFRTRAEQAMSRAQAAEKAKELVEGQLRSWREQKQRRKAAMAALREESAPKGFNPPMYDSRAFTHPPLGKVLNMKF